MHREPNEEKYLAFKDLPAKVGVIGIQDKCVGKKRISGNSEDHATK